MPPLTEQWDPRQPLKRLAAALPWSAGEAAFGKDYSPEGRPAKPGRLRVGLLLLKPRFNQGDETVGAAWGQNPYWQSFCGMNEFQWQRPWDPSDLVYFRRRIGEAGRQRILQASARLPGEPAREKAVVVPGKAKAGQSPYQRAQRRARFRRRAAIEPVIGHLKGQYRLARCFLKGFVGDQVNLLLAAAAWNLRKWLRAVALFWLQILRALFAVVELRLSNVGP
jgi:hypothetical protein